MTKEILNKALSERLPEEIFNKIHEKISQAVVCGSKPYDLDTAANVAFDLCHLVASELDKLREESFARYELIKRLTAKCEELATRE